MVERFKDGTKVRMAAGAPAGITGTAAITITANAAAVELLRSKASMMDAAGGGAATLGEILLAAVLVSRDEIREGLTTDGTGDKSVTIDAAGADLAELARWVRGMKLDLLPKVELSLGTGADSDVVKASIAAAFPNASAWVKQDVDRVNQGR